MSGATFTARLKTGAGQFKRLAESSARRVLRPTDQGSRHDVLLASSLAPSSYACVPTTTRYLLPETANDPHDENNHFPSNR
jgi:hypothetical protein